MKTRLTSCAAPQKKWRRKGTLGDVGSAVPGSAGILAGEECWLVASPARMPALPGTALNTYDLPVCGSTELSSSVGLGTGKSPEPADWKVCATARCSSSFASDSIVGWR